MCTPGNPQLPKATVSGCILVKGDVNWQQSMIFELNGDNKEQILTTRPWFNVVLLKVKKTDISNKKII
ncbi:hypothetical protein [Paenibacillus agricola]|uniref:Uncharacterized protein n=1 Tax=Paenibacillus agricola TaxID=2716264 RepID=A0ABX0J8K6_9BACL|nr:hypothetical protein [Paenibacillus agricola]NHN31519.1 hypothetical protein [Paenibacillus agricola]